MVFFLVGVFVLLLGVFIDRKNIHPHKNLQTNLAFSVSVSKYNILLS